MKNNRTGGQVFLIVLFQDFFLLLELIPYKV